MRRAVKEEAAVATTSVVMTEYQVRRNPEVQLLLRGPYSTSRQLYNGLPNHVIIISFPFNDDLRLL